MHYLRSDRRTHDLTQQLETSGDQLQLSEIPEVVLSHISIRILLNVRTLMYVTSTYTLHLVCLSEHPSFYPINANSQKCYAGSLNV